MIGSKICNKLSFALLVTIAVLIAIATVVEKHYGTQVALRTIYTSWWMCALWATMCITGFARCIQTKMWKRPALLALHISFAIILAGALTTHITSKHGYIHLRTHEATCVYRSTETNNSTWRTLSFYLCLDSFQIATDKKNGNIAIDYISSVTILDSKGSSHHTVSMNNIARKSGYGIYQTSYDDDQQGSIFTIKYDPWGTGITYTGYALLALSAIIYIWKTRRGTSKPSIGFALACLIGVAFASYMAIALAAQPLMPVLRSPMLVVHVGIIMASYCLLVVSFFYRKTLPLAVFTLAAGIFAGAIWANMSWGTYWSWDPKESWALITLIVYAIPLHTRSLPFLASARAYRIYSVLAFACLVMTYFGVNYLLGGMHSYIE